MKEELTLDGRFSNDEKTVAEKLLRGGLSADAIAKPRKEAFMAQYMINPSWTWRLKKEDIILAKTASFSDWMEKIDVRDYFVNEKVRDDLLKSYSANELKILLAGEMREYYSAFAAKDEEDEKAEKEEAEEKEEEEEPVHGEDFFWNTYKNPMNGEDEDDGEDEEESEGEENHPFKSDEDGDDNDLFGGCKCADLEEVIENLADKVAAIIENTKEKKKEGGKTKKKGTSDEDKGN